MDMFARNLNGVFHKVFNRRILNHLARESGFVQRESALDGYSFVVAMTFGNLLSVSRSLCSLLGTISDIVTRSGFHQRIDESAVLLMKMVLERTLKEISRKRCCLSPGVFRRFDRVLVWDSSRWGVHESLKKTFKGNGGDASSAVVMLQYAYDVKSSILEFFDIGSGTLNDVSYGDQLAESMHRRDLVLMDRGYYSAKIFRAIGAKGAYYITRLKAQYALYLEIDGIYQKLDMLKLLRQNKDRGIIEFEVSLGRRKDKVPSRIICMRLPNEIANKKIRKLRKNAKERGKQVSKASLAYARWTIFVTNVPREKLSAIEISEMYRMRWQVELVFKQLKSTFRIDKINHRNECRLRCEIYAILIMSALAQYIHGVAQLHAWKSMKREISFDKLFKHIQQNILLILQDLHRRSGYLRNTMKQFYDVIFVRCIKLHQPSRKTTFEKILGPKKKTTTMIIGHKKLMQFACS